MDENEGLRYCHLCGESEVDADLDFCEVCDHSVCPDCSEELIDGDDPIGVVCSSCAPMVLEKYRKGKGE